MQMQMQDRIENISKMQMQDGIIDYAQIKDTHLFFSSFSSFSLSLESHDP